MTANERDENKQAKGGMLSGNMLIHFMLGAILTLLVSNLLNGPTTINVQVVDPADETEHRYLYPQPAPVVPLETMPHGVDALELVKLFQTMFDGKEAQKPLFLMLFGPPGSGKTQIATKLLKNYGKLKNFAEIMVDNMLAKITPYRREMDALRTNRSEMDEQVFIDHSQRIYAKYRPVIKYFSAMLLDIAFRQRLNILFETTGSNTTQMLNTLIMAKRHNYDIVAVYPFVHRHELLSRVSKRNAKIGRAIPEHVVAEMEADAIHNFAHFLQYCDEGYIYDNNLPPDAALFELFSKAEYERPFDGRTHRFRCAPSLSSITYLHAVLAPFCTHEEGISESQEILSLFEE